MPFLRSFEQTGEIEDIMKQLCYTTKHSSYYRYPILTGICRLPKLLSTRFGQTVRLLDLDVAITLFHDALGLLFFARDIAKSGFAFHFE